MSIRQGRKITELTELNSASLNTYVIGVDNDVTYKVSLNSLENTIVDIFSSSVDTRLDILETQNASTDNRLNDLETNVNLENGRLDNIESETGSYLKSENSVEFYVPLFSSGNILLNSNVKVSGSSVLIGADISDHPEVPEKLAVYAGNTDSYNLISGHGTINNYLQLNIKNFGEYGNSSSDVVATADNGTEEEFYVNMGINGSAYDEDTIIGGANDAYIYGTGYNFHVGNASEYPVMIFAGGFDSKGEHLKLIISPFDNHIMSGSLEMTANLNVLGNLTASNIYSTNQTISGSIYIYDAYGDFEYPIILQTDRNGSFSISNGPIEAADGLIIAGEKYLKIVNDTNSNYDTYIENINNVGLRISASTATDAMFELSGYSLNIQNTFTASLSEGYIWVGDDNDKTYLISTSSFATTSSNKFIGDQTISGSQYISGSIILTNGAIIKDNKNSSIAFGEQAAEYNQGTQSVAIGQGAGNYDQNNGAVAVGANAGGFNQGLRATAIGSLAGGINQGEYAVALGNFAGGTNQASNSIIINATGTSLDNTITSSLKIAPIRNITGSGILQYNDITKEVSYSNIISGSTTFVGINRFETVGGDEGGEIEFGVPETNTTLSTRVVTDVYQNRFRIFDGNTKGVFIDLSKAPTGVAGELTWKSSGIVNAGTFVSLDNIKVTVTSSGNRGLSVGAVSTSFSANIGGTYSTAIPSSGGASANNVSYTTTASTSAFGWNFGSEGDTSTYIITDKTNTKVYRVTLMIGASYNNNFISIERLH